MVLGPLMTVVRAHVTDVALVLAEIGMFAAV
jgi:hypothetical protein